MGIVVLGTGIRGLSGRLHRDSPIRSRQLSRGAGAAVRGAGRAVVYGRQEARQLATGGPAHAVPRGMSLLISAFCFWGPPSDVRAGVG